MACPHGAAARPRSPLSVQEAPGVSAALPAGFVRVLSCDSSGPGSVVGVLCDQEAPQKLVAVSGRAPLRARPGPPSAPSPPLLVVPGNSIQTPALSDSKDSRQRRMCTEGFIASKTVLWAEA